MWTIISYFTFLFRRFLIPYLRQYFYFQFLGKNGFLKAIFVRYQNGVIFHNFRRNAFLIFQSYLKSLNFSYYYCEIFKFSKKNKIIPWKSYKAQKTVWEPLVLFEKVYSVKHASCKQHSTHVLKSRAKNNKYHGKILDLKVFSQPLIKIHLEHIQREQRFVGCVYVFRWVHFRDFSNFSWFLWCFSENLGGFQTLASKRHVISEPTLYSTLAPL